jgi:hypothetical protein
MPGSGGPACLLIMIFVTSAEEVSERSDIFFEARYKKIK